MKAKRYDGQIDPKTQFRHGKGTYYYRNPFFKYIGDWVDNKKHGQGRFELGDGSYYEGEFLNGEITGNGIMNWSNGNTYQGSFLNGLKHGIGEFKGRDGSLYIGEWRNNLREGKGKLTLADGTVIEGEFKSHKPNGEIKLETPDGIRYAGFVIDGIKNNSGVWENVKEGIKYVGEWLNDKKHGQGRYSFDKQGWSYEGIFVEDKPEYIASIFTAGNVNFGSKEEVKQSQETDKAKNVKGGKPDPKASTEPPKDLISYNLTGIPLAFEVRINYQGPDYQDPIQPSKEEIEEKIKLAEKDRKKVKNAPPLNVEEFYKPRMITPEPYCVTMDSGRTIEFSLCKNQKDNAQSFINNLDERIENEKEKDKEPVYKKFRMDYRELIAKKRAEIQKKKEDLEKLIEEYQENEAKTQQPKDPKEAAKAKKAAKKDPKAEVSPLDQKVDERILLFNPDEPDSVKSLLAKSEAGICRVSGLEFPEDFPPGRYKVIARDVTDIAELPKLKDLEFEIVINPADGVLDDKKKKKK